MTKQEVQQVAEGSTTLVVLEVTGDDWRGTLAGQHPGEVKVLLERVVVRAIPEQLLDLKGVAAALGITYRATQKRLEKGQLPAPAMVLGGSERSIRLWTRSQLEK